MPRFGSGPPVGPAHRHPRHEARPRSHLSPTKFSVCHFGRRDVAPWLRRREFGDWIDRKQANRKSGDPCEPSSIDSCLPCRVIGVWARRPSLLGRVKKSLTFLLCSVGGVDWSSAMGRMPLLFPLRRTAVSPKGWSALPCETSNGTWFWKRSLISMGGGGAPAWRISADFAEQDRRIFSRGCLRS